MGFREGPDTVQSMASTASDPSNTEEGVGRQEGSPLTESLKSGRWGSSGDLVILLDIRALMTPMGKRTGE